ncbi:hypothetical protein CPC08DRAFT_722529 [Agrocybe pediades]|nr:hypothetical protein CPC08DRAFT_722529 [Agrocybe pediades]
MFFHIIHFLSYSDKTGQDRTRKGLTKFEMVMGISLYGLCESPWAGFRGLCASQDKNNPWRDSLPPLSGGRIWGEGGRILNLRVRALSSSCSPRLDCEMILNVGWTEDRNIDDAASNTVYHLEILTMRQTVLRKAAFYNVRSAQWAAANFDDCADIRESFRSPLWALALKTGYAGRGMVAC